LARPTKKPQWNPGLLVKELKLNCNLNSALLILTAIFAAIALALIVVLKFLTTALTNLTVRI